MSNECLINTEFTIENYSLASVPMGVYPGGLARIASIEKLRGRFFGTLGGY